MMADSKISALPASTTPLAGTEVLPIVQGGTTKQVSVASLTDARQSVAINPVSASTMNNVAIGGTTPLAGAFTTLTSTSNATFNGVSVGRGAGNQPSNTAVGYLALLSNATDYNTAVGNLAAYQSTAAGINAFGANVLQNNTTGAINSVFGGAAVGSFSAAMFSNTTGGSNAAFGSGALTTNSIGNYNAAFGIISLYGTTGDQNTAIGYQAGSTATTGSNNGFFGYAAQPSSATVSNEYTYGNSAVTKHRFVGGEISATNSILSTIPNTPSLTWHQWRRTGIVTWSFAGGAAANSPDIAISNDASNPATKFSINDCSVLIGNTAAVSGAKLEVTGAISATTTIETGGYTVATLPSGTVGQRAYVTDASSPVYNTALTGGGSEVVPVFRNATIWVSA
jgi:hypothetical protein